MRRTFALGLFLAVSITALACKDDPNRPRAASETGQGGGGGSGGGSGGGEGGGGGDGGLDAGDGGDCTDLTNDANIVDQNAIVVAQAGAGGTVPDGIYELTGADVIVGSGGVPGPTGVTYRGVMRLEQGKVERVIERIANQGASPVENRVYGDFTASGVSFNIAQTCPGPFQEQFSYTVQGSTLNLTSLSESFTFTLRQ